MIETLKNAWKIEELRKKILFTILVIVLFRIGSVVPVPFLDPSVLKSFLESNSGGLFGYLDILTGGAFAQATLFAMSISPYINASIIIQLLTIVIPALERMSKEGAEGRKKLTSITRYLAVVLGLVQGFAYYRVLVSYGAVRNNNFFVGVVVVLSFAAGTALIMWLGEQINEKGLGNGISIILFAGIVSRGPAMLAALQAYMQNGTLNVITLVLFFVAAIAIVGFVVLITNGERRIPVQYAKRVVGRKMYGGQSTHIPLKVNMTGVMPIIFASSIVSLPMTISAFVPQPEVGTALYAILNAFNYTKPLYAILYFILIIFFNFFYVAIQYNPIEMANNMKKNGGFIPGIRPGKPTSDFINKTLSRITLMGAIFLGLIATMPIILSSGLGINIALGGTSLLIIVGVALETVKQLESQMLMRHYKGFLE